MGASIPFAIACDQHFHSQADARVGIGSCPYGAETLPCGVFNGNDIAPFLLDVSLHLLRRIPVIVEWECLLQFANQASQGCLSRKGCVRPQRRRRATPPHRWRGSPRYDRRTRRLRAASGRAGDASRSGWRAAQARARSRSGHEPCPPAQFIRMTRRRWPGQRSCVQRADERRLRGRS